jgi:hypothetical protein
MIENKMWMQKMLLLCAYAFPPKYPLIFIERVWLLFLFFFSLFFFFHAPILGEQEFIIFLIAIPFPLFFKFYFFCKGFCFGKEAWMESLFVDNDNMDMVDDIDAIFQCRSLAYVCICGCMILIIERERYLHKSQRFDKVQWNYK